MRGLTLYLLGIGLIVIGTVLACAGGYTIARSPEFLAAYRVRYIDAVFAGRQMEKGDVTYFRREAQRLRSGSRMAGAGMGLLVAGIVVARAAGPAQRRRKRGRLEVFSRQRMAISRRRSRSGGREGSHGGPISD